MSVAQVETYLDLVQSGYLVGRRLEIFNALKIRAMTNFELCAVLSLPINCISGRTSELLKRGLTEVIGTKKAPYSNKPNSVYAVRQLSLFVV